ncbi:carbohydrate ABC transporter permease [Scatolibacter rhodanostii]|uniref:carbohydrate ABC transporter permease n=1 Tax=Scatolibacter rhodanostii TaxID=2014781 RepID=UPI000C08100D|nr:carbohydrate ABC transporter permease [Scatolibacter rhodanostii]
MKSNRRTKSEIVFDTVNVLVMLLICFVLLYPIWYTVVHSFNDATDAMMGHLYWWPRKFSLDSYKAVFKSNEIFTAFGITAARTLIGTVTSVFFTAMVAYGLSKTELIGRKFFMGMGIVTMFFSGGLIPTFLLIKNLNLLDNFFVYIIPSLFSFYNLIIFQSFFRELPKELEESARVDGANDFLIFVRIIMPLSKAVLATIALFNGVYHWNEYFSGVIYINNTNIQPIQTYLYRIVAEASSAEMMANMPGGVRSTTISSQSIKLATMVVTTFPIVCIYPFLQKYFVKGMLLGSVKG